VRSKRQPGSAIKPIVYTAALDPARGGERLTAASTVPDLRREFATGAGPWRPQNSEGDYHESVTLAKALARSLNVATANLVERIGAGTVARYCERFGLGRARAVASIGLGTTEVTPLALTSAYCVFPAGGLRREPTPLRAVLDARGRDLLHAPPAPVRVIADSTAALMTRVLEDVVVFGVAYPLRARFGFTQGVAGKTGTTNDHRDTWFVGFTREVAAGVWVGYDAPRSVARAAAGVAVPVWAGIMGPLVLEGGLEPFPERPDIVLAWIDPWTGGLAREECPAPMRVPFARGTAPRAACARDHDADWQRIFEEEARAESLAAARAADSLATPPPPAP
jgi:penicillin-binding protein 1A